MASIDAGTLEAKPSSELGHLARRPKYSALHSERGVLLPSLDDALARYLQLRRAPAASNDAETETNIEPSVTSFFICDSADESVVATSAANMTVSM